MSMMAWHYTVGKHAENIRRDGFIRPATLHVRPPEKPIVWFSTRQDWEPTATPAWERNYNMMTVPMMMELAGGLWRFGMDSAEFLPWGRLKEAARIPKKVLRGLEKAARGDPYCWYGSLEPVAIARCQVECRLTEDSDWTAPP
ncbi:MAG: hypothetical protein ACRET2_02630 [Steroidobacteraceae bacterium]